MTGITAAQWRAEAQALLSLGQIAAQRGAQRALEGIENSR
jgi:hypothetical protein